MSAAQPKEQCATHKEKKRAALCQDSHKLQRVRSDAGKLTKRVRKHMSNIHNTLRSLQQHIYRDDLRTMFSLDFNNFVVDIHMQETTCARNMAPRYHKYCACRTATSPLRKPEG